MVELDYLVIGHITRDLVDRDHSVGGTATYAAQTARALGCRVGVITSTGPELDLEAALKGVRVTHVPAAATTTFENTYIDERRRQVIRGIARPLLPAMVPKDWHAPLVHIGPVAQECHPALGSLFEGAFVGVTPQGWMRQWDASGRVSRCRWQEAEKVLARANAVVLSEEDMGGHRPLAAEYAACTGVLALTRGAAGCIVYKGREVREFASPAVVEVDPTGAGDIFAASFFYALQRGHDPWAAARFANCLAAQSVTRRGISSVPDIEEVARCRKVLVEDEVRDADHLRTR